MLSCVFAASGCSNEYFFAKFRLFADELQLSIALWAHSVNTATKQQARHHAQRYFFSPFLQFHSVCAAHIRVIDEHSRDISLRLFEARQLISISFFSTAQSEISRWRRLRDISEDYFANSNPEFVIRASQRPTRNFWPKYLPTEITAAPALNHPLGLIRDDSCTFRVKWFSSFSCDCSDATSSFV